MSLLFTEFNITLTRFDFNWNETESVEMNFPQLANFFRFVLTSI